jgi:hypothetical protein
MAKKRPLEARRHWTEADARRVLAELDASGQPLKTFTRSHGLVPQRLEWWLRRLRRPSSSSSPSFSFVEATVRSTPLDAAAAVVRLPDGLSIELTGTTPAWIAALARALARPAP